MSVSWEMTEQDFEDVKHLLPQSVVAMITVIGLEATFHMVKVWGGTNYPISNRRRNTRQSRILHAQLVEDIGEEAAGRLERAYAGQPFLAIPRCWDAMRELRNRFIRRQYDAMSAEQQPPSGGCVLKPQRTLPNSLEEGQPAPARGGDAMSSGAVSAWTARV